MTTTISTRLEIPAIGPGELEIEVDYSYSRRAQELIIEGASTKIDRREMPVWHLLTQRQRATVEQACFDDYEDQRQRVVEERARG